MDHTNQSTEPGGGAGSGPDMSDQARDFAAAAADSVETSADEIRQHVDRVAESVREFLHQAADSIGHPKDLFEDLRGYARSHPGQALAGAVIAGFLAGQLIRRS